jgi:hypothetical protein
MAKETGWRRTVSPCLTCISLRNPQSMLTWSRFIKANNVAIAGRHVHIRALAAVGVIVSAAV